MPLKIGGAEIKTPYLVAGGAVAVVLIGYGVIKKKQADAAAAAASPSSSGQIDPQTGDIAGSAQDQADLAALQGGGAGLDYGGYGAYDTGLGGYGALYPNTGGITSSGPDAIDPNSGIPYAEEPGWVYNDQSGTWTYQGTGSGVGGGTYTTNAQWLQAVEQYFVTNQLVSDGGVALTSALGKYLAGSPVTPDQATLIDEATGIERYPPVSGPGGYPPGIHLSSSQGKPPAGGTVTVPNVVGEGFGEAYNAITRAGLKSSPGKGKVNSGYKVTAQDPTAGTQVASGSTVTLTAPAPGKKK
jgi:PASTA domain